MNLYKLRALWVLGLASWIGGILYLCLTGDWVWPLISVIVAKAVIVPANHIAMHRYFAHKSFSTTKNKHKFLAWTTVLIGAGSPILYATSHRHHHKYSDTELDVHSPRNGVLESSCLWEIKPFEWFKDVKKVRVIPKDLLRDPTVRFIHENYFSIWGIIIIASIVLGLVTTWKAPLFIIFCPLGWYIFGRGLFNTKAHLKGMFSYRNFDTPDDSQNNLWMHWFMLGEGLHNNHHAYPNEYNQAMKPGEWDIAAWIIDKFFLVDATDSKAYKL